MIKRPAASPERALAERVRRACLEAAHSAYEEAGVSGLCHEGRFEAALDAVRSLDLDPQLAPGASGNET